MLKYLNLKSVYFKVDLNYNIIDVWLVFNDVRLKIDRPLRSRQ